MGTFPLAVSPSILTPGFYLSVNLKAGQSSPGATTKRALLIAGKTSAGTITAGTQLVESVGGADDVATLLGSKALGYLAAKALFSENGTAQVDLVAPAEPAGAAAVGSITFGAAPTSTMTIQITICGRTIEIIWLVGVSVTDIGDIFAGLANGADVPYVFANVAGAVSCTASCKGTWGNDGIISYKVLGGAGGTVTLVQPTGGTGEYDPTTVLGLVSTIQYDYIGIVTGNTDAVAAVTTGMVGVTKTHMTTYGTGLYALLQQAIVGCTSTTVSAAKAGPNQHDDERIQYIFCLHGQSMPCEFMGAELGARMREESIDPAVNRIAMDYWATLRGAADLVADSLTAAELEDSIAHGLTPIVYSAQKSPRPARPVTTYFKDSSGYTDRRVLDTSRVTGTYAVAQDLRVSMPREFPNTKLSADLPAGVECPANTTEIKEIRKFIETRIQYWIDSGVVSLTRWQQALAAGAFTVLVNPTDETQCDFVAPVHIVPPLAKFSGVVQHVA